MVGHPAPVGAAIEPFVASSGPPADDIDLNHTASQVEALAPVNGAYANANTLLPIRIDNGVLLVACADPNDQASLRELEVLTRPTVEGVFASGSNIQQVIHQIYSL